MIFLQWHLQKRLTQLQAVNLSHASPKSIEVELPRLQGEDEFADSGDAMVTGFFVEGTINRGKLRMVIDFVDDEWIEAYSGGTKCFQQELELPFSWPKGSIS
ncbi:protein timeless-like protein [Corchorus olitorius]|uniref:Protein timeless-like protein n=1 Tax=Corchorus olitorius TaxID=93759 RepID=A0A1R3G7B2_9ROSI|nr:protein timeless-like protein [Corchorus olitorius]